MLAAPFDAERLRLTGDPLPIVERVSVRAGARPNVEISSNGTLVYAAGAVSGSGTELVWVRADGTVTSVDTAFTGNMSTARLSPDGRSALIGRLDGKKRSVFVKRLDRGPAAKVADEGGSAAWSGDGRSILFTTSRGIERVPTDGSRRAQLRLAVDGATDLNESRDGKWIAFNKLGAVYAVGSGDSTARRLIEPPGNRWPVFSPDGKWLAYTSDASSRFEVFVVPFPDVTSARYQVSTTGGKFPLWSPDGTKLYYTDEFPGDLYTVPVTLGATFTAGTPRQGPPVFRSLSAHWYRRCNRQCARGCCDRGPGFFHMSHFCFSKAENCRQEVFSLFSCIDIFGASGRGLPSR